MTDSKTELEFIGDFRIQAYDTLVKLFLGYGAGLHLLKKLINWIEENPDQAERVFNEAKRVAEKVFASIKKLQEIDGVAMSRLKAHNEAILTLETNDINLFESLGLIYKTNIADPENESRTLMITALGELCRILNICDRVDNITYLKSIIEQFTLLNPQFAKAE